MKAPHTCPQCSFVFKFCPRCKRALSTRRFWRDPNRPGGLRQYCRECEKAIRDRIKAAKETP